MFVKFFEKTNSFANYCLGLDSGEIGARHLRLIIQKNSVVFDIGSNVGEFSREILKTNSKATVYAFDIQQELSESFIELARSYKNLYFSAKGFSEEPGMSSVVRRKVGDRKARLGSAAQNKIEVTTVDIEMARLKISYLDLLKIDTEGEDLRILRGASKSLTKNRIGFILFEVLPTLNDGSSTCKLPELKDFTLFLKQFGFTHFYRVSPVLGFIKITNELVAQRFVTNILAAREPLVRHLKLFDVKFSPHHMD